MTFDDSFKEILKKRVSKVVKRVRKRARAARAARVLSLWKFLRERSYSCLLYTSDAADE